MRRANLLLYFQAIFMANQKNATPLGEYTAGKSKSISAGFLDVFIGSADFKSVCENMHIVYEPPKVKGNKK